VLVSTVIEGRPALEFTYEVLRQRLLANQSWREEDWSALHALAARAKTSHYEARRPQLLEAHAHEIAHHHVEAGQREEGHTWLMRAARGAERLQDFRAALTHLRQAASLLDEEVDPNGERLLEIRLSEGRLFRNLGEFGPAEDALRGATRQVTLRSPQLDGAGRPTLRERTLDVKIPAGVRPGQMIRLAGQGGAGVGGAAAGDLFLEGRLRPHPRFEADGANLLGAELSDADLAGASLTGATMPDGSVHA
jgi:hypothetical protein